MNAFLALLCTGLMATSTSWAEGYLSDYQGNGQGRILSDYHSGNGRALTSHYGSGSSSRNGLSSRYGSGGSQSNLTTRYGSGSSTGTLGSRYGSGSTGGLSSRYGHGSGFTSTYGSGSSSSFSGRYGSGSGYSYAQASSGWNYGGANTPIERKHRSAWQQRKNNAQRAKADPLFNTPRQNTWATRYSAAWGAIEPPAGPPPRGDYQRAPVHCRGTTTRYNPALHGK
mgnify:CR=1 FL=1